MTISRDEAQEIIKNKSGTGIIRVTKDGKARNIEMIECDNIVGEYYQKTEYIKTNKAAIYYSKRGAHLVPIKGNNYD